MHSFILTVWENDSPDTAEEIRFCIPIPGQIPSWKAVVHAFALATLWHNSYISGSVCWEVKTDKGVRVLV